MDIAMSLKTTNSLKLTVSETRMFLLGDIKNVKQIRANINKHNETNNKITIINKIDIAKITFMPNPLKFLLGLQKKIGLICCIGLTNPI